MKNFFSNDEFQLDEVLFEHRNRDYGAYNLRHESDQILTKSLFVGVFLFAAISATPFIINSFKTEIVDPPKIGTGHVFTPVDTPPDVIPPKPIKHTVPQQSTTAITLPTPTHNPPVQTPATSVTTVQTANIGPTTIIGTPPDGSFTPPVQTSVAPPVLVDPPKPANNSPVTKPDIEARFSTGIDGFRNGMINNFDTGEFEGTGDLMRTTLTFIVEKDGSISDIKANGSNADFNKEAIKTIKSIRGKWTPAKLNGENVRSYFSFPVSMKFE
jgi:protein TonB